MTNRSPILSLLIATLLTISGLSAQEICENHHHDLHDHSGDQIGFVQNKGQWEKPIQFKANLGSLNTLFLERNAFTYVFHNEQQAVGLHDAYYKTEFKEYLVDAHAYKVRFLGSNEAALQGSEQRLLHLNFFQGNDQSQWASDAGVFNKITYKDIYDNINLEAYSESSDFKYDFVVAPFGNPADIQLEYDGIESMRLVDGKLIITTSVNEIQEMAPYAWQLIDDKKVTIPCDYKLSNNILTFHFSEGYNNTLPLVIDPIVVAATLSGSTVSRNFGHTATFDNAGNIYAGGIAFGTGYPTNTGSFQTNFAGGSRDMCISKYNPDGSQMLYATYIGGAGDDYPHSMVTDFSGQLYVYGSTTSIDYPTTNNSFQPNHGGQSDIVITKLNPTGSALAGSTYLGGSDIDGLNQSEHFINYGDEFRGEIILDAQGNAYITSHTSSTNFPVTDNAFDQTYNSSVGPTFIIDQDAIVAKFNSDLSNLFWCTYLGGNGADTGSGLRLDDNNNVYVTGTAGASNFPSLSGGYQEDHLGGVEDAYVLLLSADGSELLHTTFFGTTGNDHSYFLDIDEQNNIHIYGQTTGAINPSPPSTYSTNNNSPQFLAAFNSTLSNLIYKTNIGNGPLEPNVTIFQYIPVALMVDKCDNIYFSGYFAEAGLPTTSDAIDPNGDRTFYLGVLEPEASGLSYGTYYGEADHVDGGTSRFDKSGTVYQGVCSCAEQNAVLNTTANAWSTDSDLDCDVGVFKIDFEVETVTASAFATPGTSGCLPFEVNFTYTGQDAEEYFWSFGDGNTSTDENPSNTYTESGSFTVELIASSPNTCNIADTFYLQMEVLDGSSTLQDTAICDGLSTLFLDATTTNAQYTWQDGSTGANFEVTSPGIYWVEIDIGACTRLDSFIVSASSALTVDLGEEISICDQAVGTIQPNVTGPADSYVWSTGDTGSTLQVSSPGTYSVSVTDEVGCIISDEVEVLFGFTPTVELGVFDTLCDLETVTLDAETPQVTYTWQDGSDDPTFTVTESGTYFVVLNNNGCTNSDTTEVNYFNLPDYEVESSNVVCSGECNGGLTISNNNLTTLDFIWEDGTSSTERFNLCEGDYSLTVTDVNGCTYEEFFTIVNPEPLEFSLNPIPVECFGDDNGIIEIVNLNGGFPPYTIILNGDTLSENTIIENLSGNNYDVTISDSGGCVVSETTFIYEPPFINIFAGDDRRVELGDTVKINGFVFPLKDQQLSWSPIDRFLGCQNCPKPEVQPVQTIEHVFTAVDTITGCVRSDSVILYVDKVREVYIPNAFSPNIDGMNDEFMIYAGPGVQQVNSFKIFDRWGEHIFEENNFQPNERTFGWDGTFKGQFMNNGVFVYVAEILFIDGEVLLYSGDVTLLR
ncbi:MAG: SBBP repeat-containing protein [Saprospiraceae bacterium]